MEHEGKTKSIPNPRIEELRKILEAVERRPIDESEALEVAESLLDFYTILAEEPANEPPI